MQTDLIYIAIGLFMIGFYMGRKFIYAIVKKYIDRMVITRYAKRLTKILGQTDIIGPNLGVFSRLEVVSLLGDLVSDCKTLGVTTGEVAHVLNRDFTLPYGHWEAIPDGLVFTNGQDSVKFTAV